MAPLYATVADFEGYVPGWVTDDATSLNRYLELAERDIEALFPHLPILRIGAFSGHRFDPARLYDFEVKALTNAVCAQASYLITAGDDVRIGVAAARVRGPDFEVWSDTNAAGARIRYSPELPAELAPLERLRLRVARLRGR